MKLKVLLLAVSTLAMGASAKSPTCWGTAETCGTWDDVTNAYPLGLFGSEGSGGVFVSRPDLGFHGDHAPITDIGSCFNHCQDYYFELTNACEMLANNSSGSANIRAACIESADENLTFCLDDCIAVGSRTGGLPPG